MGSHLLEQLEAGDARQIEIEQHQVGLVVSQNALRVVRRRIRAAPTRAIAVHPVDAQGKVEVHVDDFLRIAGSKPAIKRDLNPGIRRIGAEGVQRVLGPHEAGDHLAAKILLGDVLERRDRILISFDRDLGELPGKTDRQHQSTTA